MELLEAQGSGIVTINLPDHSGQCLPVFSTPFRAFDYVQTRLASGPAVRYLSSSPLQLVQMLRDIEASGIEALALDRCPRCSIFTTVGTCSLQTTDDLIGLWCIFKATLLARVVCLRVGSYREDRNRPRCGSGDGGSRECGGPSPAPAFGAACCKTQRSGTAWRGQVIPSVLQARSVGAEA